MEIIDEVRLIIAKSLKIPAERLTPDARLDDLGAESLDVIEIVFGLEEKFDITIPYKADDGTEPSGSDMGESEDVRFSTVRDVADIVKKLVDAKASR